MGESIKTKKAFDLVEIQFEDHVTSQGKPEDYTNADIRDDFAEESLGFCRVFGLLVKETEKAYHVASWIFEDNMSDWETRIDIIHKKTITALIKKHGTEEWPPERD